MRVITAQRFSRKNVPGVFTAIAITSCLGALISLLRWPLIGALSIFREPFLEIAIFGSFAVAFVWSIIHAIRMRTLPVSSRYAPFLTGVAAIVVFIFVPFTAIYLKIDFFIHVQSRTVAAERVIAERAGQPSNPYRDQIRLKWSEDEEGVYQRSEQNDEVLFYTFRGLLEHFSGFVYSATDQPPSRTDFGGDLIEIRHLQKNWYFIASV
jgi:hypothetical protein